MRSREWVEELEPGALFVPEVSTGFTDAHYLREAFGTIAYGFFPLRHTAPRARQHGSRTR